MKKFLMMLSAILTVFVLASCSAKLVQVLQWQRRQQQWKRKVKQEKICTRE